MCRPKRGDPQSVASIGGGGALGGHPAATAASLAMASRRRFPSGGLAGRRARPGVKPGFPAAHRRGLAGIEGLSVGDRFDPDRGSQVTMLPAVDACARELLLEVLDPLEAGVRVGRSRNERRAIALALKAPGRSRPLHGRSVLPRVHTRCPIEHCAVTRSTAPSRAKFRRLFKALF
jgi:hypothetical protein